jgi:hypothetical protein
MGITLDIRRLHVRRRVLRKFLDYSVDDSLKNTLNPSRYDFHSKKQQNGSLVEYISVDRCICGCGIRGAAQRGH